MSSETPNPEARQSDNLWNDILVGARRHGDRLPSKHVLILGEPGHGKSTLIEHLFDRRTSSLNAFSSSSTSASSKLYTPIQRINQGVGRINQGHHVRNTGSIRVRKTDQNQINGSINKDQEPTSTSAGLPALNEEVLMDDRLQPTEGMAVDYEWVEVNDADIENVPPISFYTAPSSDPNVLKSLPAALPAGSLPHTAALIVLDWTKPHTIAEELARWLAWIDQWSSATASRAEELEGHDKLQSHLQHYTEPQAQSAAGQPGSADGVTAGPTFSQTYQNYSDTVLPLSTGVLTHNKCGVPIIIVLTKTDRLDSVGDELVSRGIVKGKGLTSAPGRGGQNAYSTWNWDERVDWALAAIRVAGLMYGASVFYTTTGKPKTFSTLRQHILHRLYTTPPALHLQPSSPVAQFTNTAKSNSQFPFPFRANQLDRDSIMIPAGWDSWGKIEILKEGFNCQQVNGLWDAALGREAQRYNQKNGRDVSDGLLQDEDDEGIQQIWQDVIPDPTNDAHTNGNATQKTRSANEQDFLTRQLESLLKDPHRDPRRALRQAALAPQTPTTGRNPSFLGESLGLGRATPGIVGPMSSDGLSMPNVELAFAAMEGRGGPDESMQTPSMPRRESRQAVPSTTSKPLGTDISANTASNEVLNNFFQGLIAGRRTPGSTPGKDAA